MDHQKNGNGDYIREVVFGANDGMVTTLALIVGLYSAGVTQDIILIATFVALFGGAVSMALGNYISIKSQMEYYQSMLMRERWEIDNIPHEERNEIREIYAKKGFKGKQLDLIVRKITSNKKQWLSIMMTEELGIGHSSFLSPTKGALLIGGAFIGAGIIPVLPFLYASTLIMLQLSIILCVLFLFSIGAYKGKMLNKAWWRSGLESLCIATVATLVSYGVGLVGA